MALDYTFIPLNNKFPRKLTLPEDRSFPKFKKTWDRVLKDLDRETRLLNIRNDSLVLLTFHDKQWKRVDGTLRSDAPAPKYPGVVIRFDIPSEEESGRWMPMSFECDQFTTWKANVQAIVGALQSLRKVDRYGVSSRGKEKAHYEGYKALPSAEGKTSTREYAAEILSKHSGIDVKEILVSDTARASAYRRAMQKVHPDRGGDPEDFVRLTEANRALQAIKEVKGDGK